MMKWIFLFAFAFLFLLFIGLELQSQRLSEEVGQQTALAVDLENRLGTVESLEPDLGDYMKQLQFEMGKLWYAEKFRNRPLALYEIKEIEETINAVGILKPVVNKVDAAGVLQALKNSQIEGMKSALAAGNHGQFAIEYEETLLSCNECHRAAGVGFNRITIPGPPPVSNQDWRPVTARAETKKGGQP